MAHTVITGGFLSLGGTDVSADTKSISASESAELQDDTCFADTWRQRLVGLRDYQLQAELHNDAVDDALDEDLEALLGTSFAVAWRYDDGAISTGNPEYQFTGAISSINKTVAVGEVNKVSLTIMLTTSAGVTRDVTP
jgi:hypothetical protein